MPRALVIDDQAQVRATISIVLKAKGFEVVAVDNGVAGLKELTNSHFDIAIVDIYMPGIDGTKIIQLLRLRDENLPIVAISGVLLTASGRTALDCIPMAPALTKVTCLQKPFRDSELLQSIEKAIAEVA
jgi:CheY-like chemotaxis protein